MNKPLRIHAALVASAHATLARPQKALEAKWFYDSAGSDLFEQITELPEYYPTRTELGILQDRVAQLAAGVPAGTALVELGSGASTKTRILLDHIPAISRYIAVDISAAFLADVAARVAQDYPHLDVTPVAADFLELLDFPDHVRAQPKVAFFPGSTIGNLEADEAVGLMAQVRQWPGIRGFVLGVDLVKDTNRLIAAYDDAQGVTAAFNRNILHRLNREAAANFDVTAFDHAARWNAKAARIEMHLVARTAQSFVVDGRTFHMNAGDSIHTESSHKYTRDRIVDMAGQAGWHLDQFHTDPARDFGVCFLRPA